MTGIFNDHFNEIENIILFFFIRKEYSIQLDNTFEISSDIDILKRLGLNQNLGEKNTERNSNQSENNEKIIQAISKILKIKNIIKYMLISL